MIIRPLFFRLKEQWLQPTELNSPTVELFGFTFPRCLASIQQVDQFFNIVRYASLYFLRSFARRQGCVIYLWLICWTFNCNIM